MTKRSFKRPRRPRPTHDFKWSTEACDGKARPELDILWPRQDFEWQRQNFKGEGHDMAFNDQQITKVCKDLKCLD